MLIPAPAQLERRDGAFALTGETCVAYEPDAADVRAAAEHVAENLRAITALGLRVCPWRDAGDGPQIRLLQSNTESIFEDERYRLRVTPNEVLLGAPRAAGLHRGAATLALWLRGAQTPGSLPCVEISDAPRFRWRGLLLDCSRHFIETEYIHRLIDTLALFKFNVFHWHLTDDHGWRLAVEKHPKLTEIGAWRGAGAKRHGGFYSADQVRAIVAHAASRSIQVVPEIDVPGHTTALLAACPELSCAGGPFQVATRPGIYKDVLCAGNPRVFDVLGDVLDTVCELFPSHQIHLGGDETPLDRWSACPRCRARMEEEGFTEVRQLYAWFLRHVSSLLEQRGRCAIVWDEAIESRLPGVVIQAWHTLEHAARAAANGQKVIVSPQSHCYLDYGQNVLSLEKCYAFDPVPPGLSAEHARAIFGGEACLWTEYAPQSSIDAKLFPRLQALSEALWSPLERRDFAEFSERLKAHRLASAIGAAIIK
jgi:hexosaminidase